MAIKIFLDGADRQQMLEMLAHPRVEGFTTNPSLMRKAGVTDYGKFCKEILTQIRKPISFEVFADEFKEMASQAGEIAAWGDNVYVKIPIVNSRGESSIPLVRDLAHRGVKLNITALYTAKQVLDTCLAVQGGAPSIISVFAGRIADTGKDPIPLMHACAEICRSTEPKAELLWASTREAYNIVQAEQVGCRIITAPGDLIKKLSSFGRSMEELTLDTVRAFKKDAEAAGFAL